MLEKELQDEFISIIREEKFTIPNSGGLTGIETACTLGGLAGDASAGMEVPEHILEF